MWKKIAGIGLIVVLAGALVLGTGYILVRDAAATEGAEHHGRGGNVAAAEGCDEASGTGEAERHGRGGNVAADEGRAEASTAGRGYGGGRAADEINAGEGSHGRRAGLAQAEPLAPLGEWVTVGGTVVSMDDGLTLQAGEEELTFHLGPEWYWEAQGYGLAVGDQVMVTGFFEDEEFEVGTIENLTSAEIIVLRDEAGHPMWAGRGRQGR